MNIFEGISAGASAGGCLGGAIGTLSKSEDEEKKAKFAAVGMLVGGGVGLAVVAIALLLPTICGLKD